MPAADHTGLLPQRTGTQDILFHNHLPHLKFLLQFQEAGDCRQLNMTGLMKYLSKRLMPLCFRPQVVPHPWQTDLPLPSKVVIDITNHLPRQLQSPDRWEVMQRNGRVWIVETNRRLVHLDAEQYSMLLTQYNGLGASSAPPAELLRLFCASCRAQQAADQDYFVHGDVIFWPASMKSLVSVPSL